MKFQLNKQVLLALATALFATGCVPIPSQTTTVVYEAQGANVQKGTGAACAGVAWSYYRYNLDDPDLPVPVWRAKPEEIKVSVLPRDGVLEVIYSGWSTRSRKSVVFDASRIQIKLDGKIRQPRTTSKNRYVDFLWGTSLSLEFDIGTRLPATVTLDTQPKAIVVEGKVFPLPRMTFKRAIRTTTMLTRPINC